MIPGRVARLVAVGVLVVSGLSGVAQGKPEQMAQSSDESWLTLVDGAKYGESWTAAAAAFKAAVTEDKWTQAMKSVRAPLGAVESRKLTSAVYSKTLPGAPDGEYVVVQYQTIFTHKKEAVETVVSAREKDGSWKMSGYFIK